MYGEDEKKDSGSFASYSVGGDDGFVKPTFSSDYTVSSEGENEKESPIGL